MKEEILLEYLKQILSFFFLEISSDTFHELFCIFSRHESIQICVHHKYAFVNTHLQDP